MKQFKQMLGNYYKFDNQAVNSSNPMNDNIRMTRKRDQAGMSAG